MAFTKAFAPLMAVAGQGVFDDGQRVLGRLNLVHLDGLSFELFVVQEETPQHGHTMVRHLGGFMIRVKLRILGGDRDDLVIRLPESIIVMIPMTRA